jgi:tryptophan synthase alpha subunit
MPRKPTTPEERALKQQVEDLIKSIKGSDEPKIDIPRAISLFERAQKNIEQALAVLKGEEVVEELQPGKRRAGRPKKVVETVDGELFQGDAAPAEAEDAAAAPTTKRKKGAATEA